MDLSSVWSQSLSEGQKTLETFLGDPKQIEACGKFSKMLIETYQQKGKVFTCGNGGSHCDALHFAEEMTGKFRKDRPALGALALGDAPHTTCVGNDYGFEYIFARQLEGLARPGDLLLCMSTSGNSENVVKAVESAKKIGVKTMALLGRNGGKVVDIVDHAIVVTSDTSDRIQEMHIKLLHIAIETVERELFPENYT